LKCGIIRRRCQQSAERRNTPWLHAYGQESITYAPDFVINAGGLINVYHEFLGNYNRKRVLEQAEKIYDTCLDIFSFAEREVISSQEARMRLAEKRISEVGRLRMRR
jgi:leucine dehydrogenase